MRHFIKRTRIEAPARMVFDWHKRPGALDRLTPPWQRVEVLERVGGIQEGGRVTVRVHMAGLPVTWLVEHRDYIEGRQFRDVQLKGPFKHWAHTHRIESAGDDACEMIDEIEYVMPAGRLGQLLGGGVMHRELEQMFAYRHRTLAADLAAHRAWSGEPMTVAMTGASGLIGRALTAFLNTGGHDVRPMVRRQPASEWEIGWSPRDGTIEAAKLEGVDAVVHLAGESILGRWTEARKRRARDSRVQGTQLVAGALAKLDRPPRVLVNASAIGFYGNCDKGSFYGNRGDEWVDEDSQPGEGFLPEVCQQWERATDAASQAGIRTAMMRIGLVLSPRGGALKQMLPAFRAGLGGPLGDGRMWWSWVSIEDVIGAIYHVLHPESDVRGPVNVVGPSAVTNAQFTRTLGRVLRRPTVLRVPEKPVRWVMGEMADEILFANVRVWPARLETSGYAFREPELEPCLRHLLGRG